MNLKNGNLTSFLAIVAVAATMLAAPSAVRAESAVSDPGNFFANTPEFDPNAPGTKYSGSLTVAYLFTEDTANCSGELQNGFRVSNMFLVFSMLRANVVTPISADFRANPAMGKGVTPSFCFFGEPEQVAFILDMIRTQVIPTLYPACVPGVACKPFKVKSVSNVISTGQGALRADITIAVQD